MEVLEVWSVLRIERRTHRNKAHSDAGVTISRKFDLQLRLEVQGYQVANQIPRLLIAVHLTEDSYRITGIQSEQRGAELSEPLQGETTRNRW